MKTFVIGDIHGGFKSLKQCLIRSKFKKEKDRLIVLGDVCDGYPETKQCIEELLTIKDLIYVIGNHDCLSEDTQVFTVGGWKNYKDLKSNDKTLGINPNGLAQWQKINKIIVKPFSELYTLDNQRINMSITKKHRILHKTVGGFKYNTLEDYDPSNSRYQIPLASFSNVNLDYNISDSELKLLAWILTDGGISKPGNIRLYQSKVSTLNRIESILSDLGLEYKKYSR